MILAVIGAMYAIALMLAIMGAVVVRVLPVPALLLFAGSLLYWLMGARAWRMRK